MASLDVSPDIGRSYQKLVSSPLPNKPSSTYAQWAVYSVSAPLQNAFVAASSNKASSLKVHSTGEGELDELLEEFNDGKVQFAFVKIKDPNSGLPKFALVCWCGEGVPEHVKGYFTGHLNRVTQVLHGYHVQITARSDSDLSPESIIQKVADASGSKYSAGSTAQSSAPPKPASKPIVPIKPAYGPTKTTAPNQPVGSRSPYRRNEETDADGWGKDAPPVTRSQIEKVPSAYQPTRVDINALKAQPTSTTAGFNNSSDDSEREVVKGGYQPVGKIDIAALRRGYKEERPEPIKGSYQPVDVGNIRKAPAAKPEPEPQPPKPVADRMSAFSKPAESERLTSLPKPKVAKKFGTGAPSYGTKPLTPGGFGASPSTGSAPVLGVNKSGIQKSPAQLWAEKKARERGESVGSDSTPPAISPAGTGQQPVSASFTGGSVASQQSRPEDEIPSSGGVSALKNRFAGSAPMGAPTSPQRTGGFQSPQSTGDRMPPPPPVDVGSRPSALPPRPTDDSNAGIPPPPVQPPRSPTPPTPEVPGSPIRIAMPTARTAEPEEEPVQRYEPEPEISIPAESLSKVVPKEEDLPEEEPARDVAHAAGAGSGSGQKAVVLYDYEAGEDNEINLVEGQVVTNIDMVDDDWWAGMNAEGQSGLFPSNYVELMEGGAEPEPPAPAAPRSPSPEPVPEPAHEPAPASAPQSEGHTAIAIYEYEAGEENELSFPENAIITNVEFPDDDWWAGHYNGKDGLFPANYVELQNQ